MVYGLDDTSRLNNRIAATTFELLTCKLFNLLTF